MPSHYGLQRPKKKKKKKHGSSHGKAHRTGGPERVRPKALAGELLNR